MATYLYELGPAGVAFASRHGDDLGLWAIFERPGDDPISRCLSTTDSRHVASDEPALLDAFRMHGLHWRI